MNLNNQYNEDFKYLIIYNEVYIKMNYFNMDLTLLKNLKERNLN